MHTYVLTVAVTTTITPCVWMNAPVLSSQTLPMSVYVHLGLLDSTVLRVSHKYCLINALVEGTMQCIQCHHSRGGSVMLKNVTRELIITPTDC